MADGMEAVEAVDSTEVVDSVESVVDTTDAGVAEETPFSFSWQEDEKSDPRVFTKPADLADFIKHNGMRKSQYEAELKKVMDRSNSISEMEKRYQAQEMTANQLAGKYQPIDDMMKSNPQFEQAVAKLYDQLVKGKPSDPQDAFREMVQKELEPLKQFKEESEKEREAAKAKEARAAAAQRLKQADPRFDESLVEGYLKNYEEFPDEDRDYATMKIAWDAYKGSMSAAELERRSAEMASKRPNTSVTSTPGKKTAEVDVSKMTAEEIRQMAYADVEAGRL